MKRFFLCTILIAALAVAAKLALKRAPTAPSAVPSAYPSANMPRSEPAPVIDQARDSDLLARYPDDRALIERSLESFGHNARRIAATDGLRGLRLLDELGDAAICLYEERPDEFRKLGLAISVDADSARLVGAWSKYFDPRQSDREVTSQVTNELCKLPARARWLAKQTPEALPFLLTDYRRTADALERLGPAALEPLAFVDLSDRGDSLRRALNVLDRHGKLAIAATDELGPAGFLLVERFGPLIAAIEPELGIRDSLAVVASALDDLDELVPTRQTTTLAETILHLKNRDLLVAAAGTRYGLRLVVEFGRDGERVLETVGPRAADVIFRQYPEGRQRNTVVQAIAQGGVSAAATAEKFANSDKFRRILERDGAPAILAVAAACSAEESREFLAAKSERTWSEGLALAALRLAGDTGDKTIRTIDRDGVARVQALAATNIEFYQLLPLYDLSHLGGVLVQGYVPTRGEFAWAGVDAGLIAFDALSLMTLQPEGVAAAESVRATAKSGAKAAVKTGTRAVVEEATGTLAARTARTAGSELAWESTEQLGKRAAAASQHAAETASAELATSLARRSGIRLVQWETLVSVTTGASQSLAALPRSRLTKYVAINTAQAGVGLLAVHKMEEYLEGRRAPKSAPPTSNLELGGLSDETE